MIRASETGLLVLSLNKPKLVVPYNKLFGFVLAARAAQVGAGAGSERVFNVPGTEYGGFWSNVSEGHATLYLSEPRIFYFQEQVGLADFRNLISHVSRHLFLTQPEVEWAKLPEGRWTEGIATWNENDIVLANTFLHLWLNLSQRVGYQNDCFTTSCRYANSEYLLNGAINSMFHGPYPAKTKVRNILELVIMISKRVFIE